MLSTVPPDLQFRPEPTESQVVSGCLRWLYQCGFEPIRNNTGGFSKTYTDKHGHKKTHHIKVGKKGTGDILVCSKSGRWVEIECKRPSTDQSPDQIERQKHVERMGGIYLVIRSVDELEAQKGVLA